MISNVEPAENRALLAHTADKLVENVEFLRLQATRDLDPATRSELGQFLTPPPVARLMASMFERMPGDVRLLDPGSGVGSLTAAFVETACARDRKPRSVSATAFELDPKLAEPLRDTLRLCAGTCSRSGVAFDATVRNEDFLRAVVSQLDAGLFKTSSATFNCAIINPPYKKFNTDSEPRVLLRRLGFETSNLYTAFLALAIKLLEPEGELVAITPRSFCNGPYFRPFRDLLLDSMSIKQVHVYESRDRAFSDDDVLQENIIFHAIKNTRKGSTVLISSSDGPGDEFVSVRDIDYGQLVRPNDPDRFIHIVPDELGDRIAGHMTAFTACLADLGLEVSTGRVVDFRAREHLLAQPAPAAAPLIYPGHFVNGFVAWPKAPSKKPNAISVSPATADLLMPAGMYVLVKRFSSKEERRRVVAALYDPARVVAERVGFENHLNVFHRRAGGVPEKLARGLAVFLNSTLLDSYFRQFNGHTQVNATDLRSLKYPTLHALEDLGSAVTDVLPDQDQIDHMVEERLLTMTTSDQSPVRAKKKIEEAIEILVALGYPRAQQNERSALALLALLNLKPSTPWSKATAARLGITPMMDFFSEYYGKKYAPNTRETVRRQTIHQFMDGGLVVVNPDDPDRPTNSGDTVYEVSAAVLLVVRTYGTPEWDKNLKIYLDSVETLKKRYAQEREMSRIPISVAAGKTLSLSPGGQNVLVQKIIEEFGPLFAPGGQLVYVGDTDEKFAYFDEEILKNLGIKVDAHGKMPDVIVYQPEKKWLLLIEAVTSHGPVNAKRRDELAALFKTSRAGLVYVTAFLDRKTMMKYLDDISWETEVWVVESPTHMVHFNGARFLGPYEKPAPSK